jgi:hypothetical protein
MHLEHSNITAAAPSVRAVDQAPPEHPEPGLVIAIWLSMAAPNPAGLTSLILL